MHLLVNELCTDENARCDDKNFLDVIREGSNRSRGLLNARLLRICSILLLNCALHSHRLPGSNRATVFKNETKYPAQGNRGKPWIVVCKTALAV